MNLDFSLFLYVPKSRRSAYGVSFVIGQVSCNVSSGWSKGEDISFVVVYNLDENCVEKNSNRIQ